MAAGSIVDLAIVGAGPAGMGAAIEAAALGLSVTVLDEQPAPGGQVFRAVEAASGDPALQGEFATQGAALGIDPRRPLDLSRPPVRAGVRLAL